MTTHESSVNFKNLIKDLAEMYPYDVSEVVVIELIANALDAKAKTIKINYDHNIKLLTLEDDGDGMDKGQFNEYHDFAAGLKKRGSGIGFAGVGAKISFNIAHTVTTETHSDSFSGGSKWSLLSNKKLIWEEVSVKKNITNGTKISIQFNSDSDISYATASQLTNVIYKHFLPLFNKDFLNLYTQLGFYPEELSLLVNNRPIKLVDFASDFKLVQIYPFMPQKNSGKKYGLGLFGLYDKVNPLFPDMNGVLLCSHGKVVKSDFFNQYPGSLTSRIFGIIEIPEFIDYLTTSKTDFIHKRSQFKDFEKLYGPLRDQFKKWLIEIGITQSTNENLVEARKLERELNLLIESVPELGDFFGFRARTQALQQKIDGDIVVESQPGSELTNATEGQGRGVGPGITEPGDGPGNTLVPNVSGTKNAAPISRVGKKGPKISFGSMPDRLDMAWIDGNNIIINSGHPTYRKTSANGQARKVYCLFVIANAIQKFIIENQTEPDFLFIDKMITAWGKQTI